MIPASSDGQYYDARFLPGQRWIGSRSTALTPAEDCWICYALISCRCRHGRLIIKVWFRLTIAHLSSTCSGEVGGDVIDLNCVIWYGVALSKILIDRVSMSTKIRLLILITRSWHDADTKIFEIIWDTTPTPRYIKSLDREDLELQSHVAHWNNIQ